jgi:magnesium transporter
MDPTTTTTHLHEWIEAREFGRVKTVLNEMEVHDLADLLAHLEHEQELPIAFRMLKTEVAAEVLGYLGLEQQELLMTTLKSNRVADIINEMAPDDRTGLLEELPGELAQKLMAQLRGDELKVARDLMAYPEDSIGRWMTPEYVAAKQDWTVERLLQHLRKVAPDQETIYVIYVVDDRWKLMDEVYLEDVVLSDPETKISALMDGQVPHLVATDDQETAIEAFRKYDALALPVVDTRGTLVGIVTHDDVMDISNEEANEDFQKVTGMGPLESSYFSTNFAGMLRSRLPWLALLLCCQAFTTVALLSFEKLKLFAILVVFMPLINSPAGNTGSQIAGLMIRGLAVQEISLTDWWRVLRRELLRGFVMGLGLAAMGFVVATIFARWSHIPDVVQYIRHIAVAVSIAIVLAVTLANLIGSMLPFFFKRLGMDPAVTSGPFLASLMDVTGIVIYFSIGMTILNYADAAR